MKTDRRDAEKLARCYRAGELTAVWVPDEKHEALRDLVRAREAAKQDQLRHRHQLGKVLLRHGKRCADGSRGPTKRKPSKRIVRCPRKVQPAISVRGSSHESCSCGSDPRISV